MTALERVVRPALGASIHPAPSKLDKQEPAADEAVLEFGGPGQSVFTVKLDSYTNLETVEQQREISRTYDVVRVKNPDDPTQHVDVESVRKVTVQDDSGKRREIEYQEIDPSEVIEILKRNQIKSRTI